MYQREEEGDNLGKTELFLERVGERKRENLSDCDKYAVDSLVFFLKKSYTYYIIYCVL